MEGLLGGAGRQGQVRVQSQRRVERPVEEPQAKQVREMYAAGRPVPEIAEEIGVSRATVYRCLKT
ncbi:helix-turn-helix domain-containing protein [Lentzea kristufekii]|uniref:helix-turn-helix domain-containing protein n=1 Tax=Lentzea kristufekii TaxID=3095430 RepID=UPI0038739438